MMNSPLPLTRDLVLIGGGHAHALVLRMFGMRPLAGARLTVINPSPTAPYTGMLPGHVAGHYSREALDIDLVRLCRFAGARLILDRAAAIDRDNKLIHVTGRSPIGYDIASLDIGITSDMPSLPGFTKHAHPAKPLDRFADNWQAFLDATPPQPRIAVIGGGVGGVELALAMTHALTKAGKNPATEILDRGPALANMTAGTRAAMMRHLSRAGITLTENAVVAQVTADGVELASGRVIASDFTLGAGGARPQDWLRDTGLDLADGFVTVDPFLRSSDPAIFAVGDCAHMSASPRPKAGVFAVRQAPVLFRNLRAALTGGSPQPYRPQRDFLKLISTGGKSAVADKWGLPLDGAWLWRWKDRIDRRFMDRLNDLPQMPAPDLPTEHTLEMEHVLGPKPMCGGCGAKVGGARLEAVLSSLPNARRKDVLSEPGDDAAILLVGGQQQVLTTDHLRAFTLDPYLMARITAVHALGDIWAMAAEPQSALAQVILPRLSPVLQERWLAEIMQAATGVFAAEGAVITGGHTTMGDELTLGFTVTGLTDRPVTLTGARPGDALILTKPVGTGVILAAEMAGQARGAWVAAAMEMMAQPQGSAARLLADAHAMTDVTGFGLAGHLLNICRASGVAARLKLDAIPLYEGAEELAAGSVRSTLYPDNRSAVAPHIRHPDTSRADLLFDPQTAGGLLAACDPGRAPGLVQAIRDTGLPAAIIGEITNGPPAIQIK